MPAADVMNLVEKSAEKSIAKTCNCSPDQGPDIISTTREQAVLGNVLHKHSANDPPAAFVPTPIAICGMAVRLPGGIRDTTDFWDLLVSGRDARALVPDDRYHAESSSNDTSKGEALHRKYGYFIDEDLSTLDTSFFTFSRQELERTDPQQRQLLEVAYECLESAGENNYSGRSIGCYVGTFGEDWLRIGSRDPQQMGRHTLTGYNDIMLANRISYEYNLKGPSIVIKTGCSSSMIALHQACRAIQTGDCEAALVAGTNLIMTSALTDMMATEGILSTECSSKTFDAKADGFARAEAINAVYIKSLDDAVRDGNPIRAVIRNTTTNSGGRSSSLMAPSELSHESLIRKAYSECNLDPRETPFVECHGTGTLVGDQIETTAVGRVFGERGALIGSVKPNVGHSEGASGLTSLIKAVLAIEHNTVPPNIKFDRPNPQIPFRQYNLTVPVRPVAWPADRPRRISVNSFGIGGANAHAIVEAHGDSKPTDGGQQTPRTSSSTLLLCSANTPESLQTRIDDYQAFIKANPRSLPDMAFTLAMCREHLRHRAFIIAKDASNMSVSTQARTVQAAQHLVMVFSGQGAQWPCMGSDLMQSDSEFLGDIQMMDKVLQASPHAPEWSIELELRKRSSESNLQKAEFAQPLCTAIQIALVNMFFRAGLRPAAVVGHSSGEIAAAYASGLLSQRLAILIAFYRGFVTKAQGQRGGMAAVALGVEEVAALLCPGVVVACENSPVGTTISGDLDKVQSCIAGIRKHRPDTLVRLLNVDQAYHSDHVKNVAGRYLSLVSAEYSKEPHILDSSDIKFFSSVHRRQVLTPSQLRPKYWSDNLVSPVLFAPAISQILSTFLGCVFLEIGPHSTLLSPIRQVCIAEDINFSYVPSMLRKQDGREAVLSAFGQLFQKDIISRYEGLVSPGRTLWNLPRYPWHRMGSYWFESRLSKERRNNKFEHHGLVGTQVFESTALEPMWRNILSLENEPWLLDHMIGIDVIFPLAGYCAIAGEAVRHLSGGQAGYCLRRVRVHAAMVLKDSEPTEVVTTLRPSKTNGNHMSELWTFSICSYTGSSWMKNCEGLVKARKHNSPSIRDYRPLARQVPCSTWYEAMAQAGIVYGPSFRGMRSISSSTIRNEACAIIQNTATTHNQAQTLHPTMIDACFQVVFVALTKGLGRNFVEPMVPIFIEALDVSGCVDKMQVTAIQSAHNSIFDIRCSNGDDTILQASGLQLRATNQDATVIKLDPHAAAQLKWRPHVDFVDHGLLFESPVSEPRDRILLEEVTFLCLIDSAERLRNLTTQKDHFDKYRHWLQTQINQVADYDNPILGDIKCFLKLSDHARTSRIEEGFKNLGRTTVDDCLAIGVRRIWQNIEKLFTGAADTLELLMRDDVLTRIYNTVSFGHSGFIQLLSHSKPNLRILEVGAGTGGTTQTFLRDLIDIRGTPQYAQYVFTDVSAGFFPLAQERFSYAPNLEFRVFDISNNPLEQGFEVESFDLILASNVVHATPVLRKTLENLKMLLRRDGNLVLTELTPVAKTPAYIFGNFSGWWLGEQDERGLEPYVSTDRWDSELKAAGFTGTDTIVPDANYPLQYSTIIVSRPDYSSSRVKSENHLTIICSEPSLSPAIDVIQAFKKREYVVNVRKLGEETPSDQTILSVLELEKNFVAAMAEEHLKDLQKFLREHQSLKMLWLTMPSQIACRTPEAAMAVGMARSIRAELDIQLFTFEVDPQDCRLTESVLEIMGYIVKASDQDNDLLPDLEFALHEGFIKVGRYHPYSITEHMRSQTVEAIVSSSRILRIEKPGMLDTLSWVEVPRKQPLAADEVEIHTLAVGINHEDIDIALGKLTVANEDEGLGVEAVGKIIAVGSNVNHLMVDDVVVALCAEGCAATSTIVRTSLIAKVPERMSIQEAATMPLCFATALYSLTVKGQLERGQSVLIHHADNNAGLAAVHVCRMVGAKVFATVSSEKGHRYLAGTVDIPENHILRATSDHFQKDVMYITENMGFDLVLNLTSGEWSNVLARCVASFGVLIDVWRRGYGEFDEYNTIQLSENVSYHRVDMMQLIRQRPQAVGRLLKQTCEGFLNGTFSHLPPATVYKPHDVIDVFTHLQREEPLGGVLIDMSSDSPAITGGKSKRPLNLDPSASYLLTGGLGGIGKSLAVWMVERGAKSLTFLSPSAGISDEDRLFGCELESLDCSVNFQRGRAENIEDVSRAVSSTKASIKGVVHLAMVLRDASVTDMSYADWNAAVKPKVQGAWNLHNVLKDQVLDFFVLASSLFGTVEWPGQCNYSAGNTFLEGFCQFRRQHGLAASVIGIGPVEGVGFLTKNTKSQKRVRDGGLYFLREQHLLDSFELAMKLSKPIMPARTLTDGADSPWKSWCSEGQFITGLRSDRSLSDPTNRIPWRRDRRMGFYHNMDTMLGPAREPGKSDILDAFLIRAASDIKILDTEASVEVLSKAILTKLAELTLRTAADISLDGSVAHSGLDSLTAIELRRWWKRTFGLEVSILELTAAGSLRELGRTAAEKLKVKLEIKE